MIESGLSANSGCGPIYERLLKAEDKLLTCKRSGNSGFSFLLFVGRMIGNTAELTIQTIIGQPYIHLQ